MGRRLLTLCAVLLLAFASGCAGDDDDAGPTATVGTVATTTTAAVSVEEEVEAAYLRSWDVYAEAMRTFDTSQLAEVYLGDALNVRLDEVGDLRATNTPARMDVKHNIVAVAVDGDVAVIRDQYMNHSVLLNADGSPAEEDPNEVLDYEYLLRKQGGTWKVALVTPR